jgi:hypothetical protein
MLKDDFRSHALLLLLLSALSWQACVNVTELEDVEIIYSGAEYAVPLVNSRLTLETVLTDNFDNAFIDYDENGVAVVHYASDLIRKNANEIFKPIVFPGPLPFTDTVVNVRFDQQADYEVEKGVFRGDSIRFGFTSPFDETISVRVGIPQASLNGAVFVHEFEIAPNSSKISPLYSLRGYGFESPENQISFYYDARNPGGERVILENPYFEFTYLVFDFLQGYLGKNIQNLNAQDIQVNIFDLWESGLLEFADPKIRVRLDNSFGFPVQAIINTFEITNLSGEVIPLESTLFEENTIFDYPRLNEVGTVKSSEFVFDKENSNFATAFNQKVIRVTYDVDALANPEDDENIIGFYTFDSYYLLNVSVELPMQFKAGELKLAGKMDMTTELPEELDLVESIELKCYLTNLFPVDATAQLYFLDEAGEKLDSLFQEGAHYFPAASTGADGNMIPAPGGTDPFFITYDAGRKETFKSAKKVETFVVFDTSNNPGEWTTITRNQGLDVKIGLKFKLN